jgi:uncharacterized protein DUF5916
MKLIIWVVLFYSLVVALVPVLFAENTPSSSDRSATIPRMQQPPTLEDFVTMEPSPRMAGKMARIEGFRQWIPHDGDPVSQRTVAYLGYDEKNFYAVFVCFDKEPGKIRAHLGHRDDIWDDDFVDVWIDSFHDHRRAYEFVVNPLGVQGEGLATDNNEDFSFDTVWDSRGQINQQGWVAWIAIPFKSLRFTKAPVQTWGITLQREIHRANEKSFWPYATKRQEGIISQNGEIHGMENISPGRNMQFIPYGLFRSFRGLDLRDPNFPTFDSRAAKFDGGLDSKFIIKDSLVLDATIEPDFSQVESDEPQVTVSQRFEVFFPEKRPFFQENSNYFDTPINLFFTRRIVHPQFGSRLTGKIGKYSLGMLLADDRSPGLQVPENDPLANKRAYFAIGRVSRDILKDSNVGLMYTDREFDGSFNRVGGVDATIRLSKTVVSRFQAVESSTLQTDGTYLAGPAFEGDISRYGHSFNADLHYRGRSDGFRTETGFDPQPDIHNEEFVTWYNFWPKKHLLRWGLQFDFYRIDDHEGNRLNWGYIPEVFFEMPRQTRLTLGYAEEAELLRPRDFSVLLQNKDFVRNTKTLFFSTAPNKQIIFDIDWRWGRRINYAPPSAVEPYLARRNSVTTDLSIIATSHLRIDNTYLWFRLGDFNDRGAAFNNHIIRSKWNYQFTPKLSARIITQYSAVLANPAFTSLATTKNLNADFLISYLVHPGTAVYVGYNSNLQNLDHDLALDPDGNLVRTRNSFINDSRQFFVKVSYLFRF